nr:unnamed protein product [Callosobruchus analis]
MEENTMRLFLVRYYSTLYSCRPTAVRSKNPKLRAVLSTWSNSGHKPHGQSRCDPHTQNCGQPVQPGQATNTGQWLYGQVATPDQYNQGTCDPLTQNCGQQFSMDKLQELTSEHVIQNSKLRAILSTWSSNSSRTGCQSRCDPGTQNCGRQVQHGHVATTGQHACDPRTQNCNQYYPYDYVRAPEEDGQTRCDPATQNCGQQVQHGHVATTGQHACDPRTQNCNQYYQHGHVEAPEPNGQNRCNPLIRNCQGAYYGQASRTFQATCDPRTQNCGQYYQPGQYEAPEPDGHTYTGYSSQVTCDPRTQIVDSIINMAKAKLNKMYKESVILRLRIANLIPTQNSLEGRCNPQEQNCSPSSHREPKILNHNAKSADCILARTATTQQTTGKYVTSTIKDGYQGITKHPTDCRKFLNCANGQTFVQDCAPGTLFNPKLGNCDFPYNVNCDQAKADTHVEENTEDYDGYTESYGGVPSSTWYGQYEDHSQYSQSEGSSTQREHRVKPITETNRGKSGILIRPVTPHTLPMEGQSESISSFSDYVDIFDPKEQKYVHSTTPRAVSRWPIPIPTTDPDADYIFEYDDGEPITLKPESIIYAEYKKKKVCGKGDFYCSSKMCITKAMVCDGHRDCENGRDEKGCEEFIGRFTASKNAQLEVLEKQRWINVSYTTCAMLCIQSSAFNCRSFNYRSSRVYNPFDYYELSTGTIDCSDRSKYFQCSNKKCLIREQLCDGTDDCGDRQDEKNCSPKEFGYSIKLAGAKEKNKGRIEITEANIVCKELGFEMGAIDVKGQSYFAKDVKENNTLYMMDDLKCFGNENTLLDCNFAGWGIHDCQDLEIVGVVCKTPEEKCGKGFWKCATTNECVPLKFMCDDLNDCSDDSDEDSQYCEVRRLEVSHYGIWGTVCDDDFNEDAAKFVCKRLGYKGASTVKKDGYFGAGSGPIWLDQVSCSGEELDLKDCTTWDWGEHNCDHNEDVGIICDDAEPEVEVQRHAILPPDGDAAGLAHVCGLRKDNQFMKNDLIQARVVKGATARRGDYPWQANYLYLAVTFDVSLSRYIEEYFIHEQYRKGGHKMNNDVALVKLKGVGFEFTDDVQAICLPDADTDYESDLNCTISGYGSVKTYSHKMMAAWIPILSKKVCNMPHIYDSALTDGMICAGLLDGGVDSCDGDSGGPLACLNQGFFTLYGITSWGHRCGFANKPGVYTMDRKYNSKKFMNEIKFNFIQYVCIFKAEVTVP